MRKPPDPDGRQVFRSPVAVAIWWMWALFALGNLIDLAVQGRDHLSLVAACTLLLVTGIVYATAQRPRIIADVDELTIVNPLRAHRVGWPAVTAVEPTELMRVVCTWSAEDEATGKARAIYAWAVHSSRRRQVAEEMRAQRRARGGSGGRIGFGSLGMFGGMPTDDAPPPAPIGLDMSVVVSALTVRAEKARAAAPDAPAAPPVSAWHRPTIAAIVIPALLLLIVVLA